MENHNVREEIGMTYDPGDSAIGEVSPERILHINRRIIFLQRRKLYLILFEHVGTDGGT
jgi:hypothetical protein